MNCCYCGELIKECMGFMGFPGGKPFENIALICDWCGTRLWLIADYGLPPIRLEAAK